MCRKYKRNEGLLIQSEASGLRKQIKVTYWKDLERNLKDCRRSQLMRLRREDEFSPRNCIDHQAEKQPCQSNGETNICNSKFASNKRKLHDIRSK